MERALEELRVGEEEAKAVEGLPVRAHRAGEEASFYEGFAVRGIRVDRIQPGFLSCSFTVPPRLTDRRGEMAAGAIANLVDEVGFAAVNSEGHGAKVSVDMNIAFITPAKLGDELEIRSRVLGHKGGYSGTHVLLRNKVTGQVIAEGRHSLFGNLKSKI
ncbi:acyl-coenzyme A thioesterase 13 [Carex littledalei]|uniref:Acyl-coenzyme A thioesterase 13 n=1 Tax=Carex littledalei TaxID=544730 RepID=A0A833R5J3_9POAL|nr:acyl-coenzyme A thioesterase 13 [Carex littledalei]